jgi:AcrR family transcriptional regulator
MARTKLSDAPRQRMTRDEQRALTRTRLLEAAEELFSEQGIGETSIEEIAEAAGYSRGAFYSNFADRDELVLDLIERHQDRSMAEANSLLDDDTSPAEFLERLFARERNQSDRRSTIGMEYILYAARNVEGRPRVKELNDRLLDAQGQMIEEQYDRLGVELPISSDFAAKVLFALDEGYALLRLLDPEKFHIGIWGETVAYLNEATLALVEKRAQEDS